jgi:N6-L-threonylcarbamoyladenine synthase
MKILGIETSCDETAAAVVLNGSKILSNIVASSKKIHAKTGGIIPENAARQQIKSIIPVIFQSLKLGANLKLNRSPSAIYNSPTIDAIAVTIGPGLIGSLLVGVETAKSLSYIWKKPLIPVNHLTGHIYANWLYDPKSHRQNILHKTPNFPSLALVVSGGHTDLVMLKGHNKLKWLGGTLDDAAGETFDKTARLLKLGYPGGPAISKHADKFFNHRPTTTHSSLKMFPRPLLNKKNFDFSFSGLKTSVLNKLKYKKLTSNKVQIYSAEIQEKQLSTVLSIKVS